MKKKLLRNDVRLLEQLRKDARQPVLALSSTANICRTTVAKRLSALQKGIIQKYTALLNFQQLGLIHVQLSVTVLEEKMVFERFMKQQHCLNSLYATTAGYVAELLFSTKTEAEHFLSNLEDAFSFCEMHVHFITQELVRESFSHYEGYTCN